MNRRILIFFFILISILSYSQTVTWDGGGSADDWHDPLNWDGDILPTSGDEVIINPIDVVTIFNGSVSVRRIVITGTLTISPGLTLTLDAPGEIALDVKSSTGQVINQGTIDVLNAGNIGIYINTGAAFDNELNAEINCENIPTGTAINLQHNNSILTNEGTINISNNINRGINVNSSSKIDNKGGDININSIDYSGRVAGLLINEGVIEVTSTGSQGFWILGGTIINESPATLRVLSSSSHQVAIGNNGLLDNYGTIELLGNSQNFSSGINLNGNGGQMINRSSGNVIINICTWDGIYISSAASIDNYGIINISDNIGRNGIHNIGVLTNHSMSEINISDTNFEAIYMNGATSLITNDGTINILSNINSVGINDGIAGSNFINNESGLVSIDSTSSHGISAPFVNHGTIELKSGIGGIGIGWFGSPVNQVCGTILSEINIYTSSFVNQGTIITSYSSSSITANSNFINNGVIEDLLGPATITNFNNNGYRITTIPGTINEGDATSVIEAGLAALYSGIDISWYNDAARSIPAGVYVPITNEWVPNHKAVGFSNFYLSVEYPQGCNRNIQASLDNAVTSDPGLQFESIVASGYWNDPSTWDQNKIPRAIDDVYSDALLIIPDGYSAKAKSLHNVNILTIESSGELTIYDSAQEGLINDSKIELFGKMIIYQSVSVGIENNFVINIHPCGELFLFEGIDIGKLTNQGYIYQNYAGANYGISSFKNSGAIEDSQGSFNGLSFTNNELIIKPQSAMLVKGEPLPDALDITSASTFITISEQWYLDPNFVTEVGSYNQNENTWIPNENAVGSSVFYMGITTAGFTCPSVMKIVFDTPIEDCTGGSIALNAGATDYYDIGSWNLSRLPNSCDDITIPLATDTISLPASHDLEYKGIKNYGTIFIPIGTEVTIDDAASIAIDNLGDMTNYGDIIINNPTNRGIYTHTAGSSFNNKKSIDIINAGTDAIHNSGGYFLNDSLGDIYILLANSNGIYNQGTFDSFGDIYISTCDNSILNNGVLYSGGNIDCINADSYSVFNTSGGSIENLGTMTISGASTIIGLWNTNSSLFINELDGELNINGTSRSIDNFGSGTKIENIGVININNTTSNLSSFINQNKALFTNAAGASLNLSGTPSGMENKTFATFLNHGTFSANNITNTSLSNSASFQNKQDGIIDINNCKFGISNTQFFTNEGVITLGPNVTIRQIRNSGSGTFTLSSGSQTVLEE